MITISAHHCDKHPRSEQEKTVSLVHSFRGLSPWAHDPNTFRFTRTQHTKDVLKEACSLHGDHEKRTRIPVSAPGILASSQ